MSADLTSPRMRLPAHGSGIADLSIVQSGVDTLITFDGGSVPLRNATAADIDAADLVF